jgi:hypothetical protein
LYWAVIGLILESRGLDKNDISIISELSKRILSKIEHSTADPRLNIEFKNLSVIVCDLAHDFSGLLDALNLESTINPSDYLRLEIEANMKIEKFEKAKSICLVHFKSHTFIDAKIWGLFLEILCNLKNGFSIAYDLIESYKSKCDIRSLKCAALELKLMCKDACSKSAADMLFDFCADLYQKPSTFNDAIFFLKKFDYDGIKDFYCRISAHIESVIFYSISPCSYLY